MCEDCASIAQWLEHWSCKPYAGKMLRAKMSKGKMSRVRVRVRG